MDASEDHFAYRLASFISFRDTAACERVRGIPRDQITEHVNPDFRIEVIDDRASFYQRFADDLVGGIRDARDAGTDHVIILPVGPTPQFKLAAQTINEQRISLSHVHTFNMDEYADEDGNTAPQSWPGSFKRAMWEHFFGLIDEDLRPSEDRIHFPTGGNADSYSDQIEQAGGADVCYGGIGWCGHIAFWEAHLGEEFDSLESYLAAGSRVVELHPMTIMQNALHSFGGDWSWVPPKAVTIGPKDIMEARHRSFWLDGDLGGGVSWQRFISRLVAHGPVSTAVPGSILQLARTDYRLLGGVADDVEIEMS